MKQPGAALRKITANAARHSAANGTKAAPVLAWPLVCGPAVAAHTRALAFCDGVLQVEAPDETWRAQLADFAPTYAAALNQMVSERVRRVEFVSGQVAPHGKSR